MGLMDAFRGKRRDDPAESGGLEDAAAADVPEPMFFTPRTDGRYVADDGEVLRFAPGGRVFRTPAAPSAGSEPGPAASAIATGEYTPGGRFVVQVPFERPVFFAALDFSFERFVARRTETANRNSMEREYRYQPNAGAGGDPGQAADPAVPPQ